MSLCNHRKVLCCLSLIFPFFNTAGTFTIKLPKLHPGETFENLDLLTTLLAPRKKAPVGIKPLIEVVGELLSISFLDFLYKIIASDILKIVSARVHEVIVVIVVKG